MIQLHNEVDVYNLLPSPDQSNERDVESMLITPFSKYFSTLKLNHMKITNANTKPFTCIHFNVRSLSKHFDELTSNLSTFDNNFDVIALSETRLNKHITSNINLLGYDFFQ